MDTHTVHETAVIRQDVTNINTIENFATNFVKVYYVWEQPATSIAQGTEKLKDNLTNEMQALNTDAVCNGMSVSFTVQDYRFGLWKKLGIKCINGIFCVEKIVGN